MKKGEKDGRVIMMDEKGERKNIGKWSEKRDWEEEVGKENELGQMSYGGYSLIIVRGEARSHFLIKDCPWLCKGEMPLV